MANWLCSVFNTVCVVKRLSSPRCRPQLIDFAWVVIVPGQKMHKTKIPCENVCLDRKQMYPSYLFPANDAFALKSYPVKQYPQKGLTQNNGFTIIEHVEL